MHGEGDYISENFDLKTDWASWQHLAADLEACPSRVEGSRQESGVARWKLTQVNVEE